jgi:hypothetical protein
MLGSLSALYSLKRKGCLADDGEMTPKRSLSVSIKMSEEDLALLTKAAAQIWPKAILTRSAVVLGLAKIGAESVLSTKKR